MACVSHLLQVVTWLKDWTRLVERNTWSRHYSQTTSVFLQVHCNTALETLQWSTFIFHFDLWSLQYHFTTEIHANTWTKINLSIYSASENLTPSFPLVTLWHYFQVSISMPATQAVRKQAMEPATKARKATLARSPLLDGAIVLRIAIWIPEKKFLLETTFHRTPSITFTHQSILGLKIHRGRM